MKALHLTYYSLSGVISHIILKNVFKDIRYITCGYEKLSKNIDEIYINKERLICTNFALSQKYYDELLKLDEKMIYIDHHLNSEKLKKSSNKNIINRNFSSCVIVYKIFEKFIKKNKEELKKLAVLGDVYDTWRIENKDKFNYAYGLNELFWKYNFELFVEKFKNGFRNFSNDEIKFINGRIENKFKRLEKLDKKDLNKKNAVLFVLKDSDYDLINDIQLGYKNYDIFFIYLPGKKKLSIKHKMAGKILYDVLEYVFKNRNCDEIEFFGNCFYGSLNYKKISDKGLVIDLNAILNRM